MNLKTDFNIEYAHIYADELVSTNNLISNEQKKSVDQARKIIKDLKANGNTYSLNILVDDYNEPAEVDEENLFRKFKELGLMPDHIMRESQMISSADFLLKSLPEKYIKTEEEKTFLSAQTRDILLWAPGSYSSKSFKEILVEQALGKSESKKPDDSIKEVTYLQKQTYSAKSEIVLKYREKNEEKYACPLITACWYLMRLDVEPFKEAAKSLRSFSSKPFFGKRLITILPSKYLKIESTAMEIISLAKSKTFRKCKKDLEYYFF